MWETWTNPSMWLIRSARMALSVETWPWLKKITEDTYSMGPNVVGWMMELYYNTVLPSNHRFHHSSRYYASYGRHDGMQTGTERLSCKWQTNQIFPLAVVIESEFESIVCQAICATFEWGFCADTYCQNLFGLKDPTTNLKPTLQINFKISSQCKLLA